MRFTDIERDESTGLVLVRDDRDPPRYYLRNRRRLDLLAIGDKVLARHRFAVRCDRQGSDEPFAEGADSKHSHEVADANPD